MTANIRNRGGEFRADTSSEARAVRWRNSTRAKIHAPSGELIVYPERPTVDEVVLRPGMPGEHVETRGWSGVTRPIAESLYWSEQVEPADGVNVLASFPGKGTWRRFFRRHFLARRNQINGVDAEHDTTALQNLIDKHCTRCGEFVELDASVSPRVMDTLWFAESRGAGRGCGMVGSRWSRPTRNSDIPRLIWYGPDDREAIRLEVQTSLVGFAINPATALHCAVNIGNTSAEHVFSGFRIASANHSAAPIFNGIALGLYESITSNIDRVLIEDCFIYALHTCIAVKGGQPYGMQVRRTYLDSGAATTGVVEGIGLLVERSSFSVHIQGCHFGALSTAIGLADNSHYIMVDASDIERCKRFIGSADGSTAASGNRNIAQQILVRGGRFTQRTDIQAAAAENPHIDASDRTYIHAPHMHPLLLEGCRFRVADGGQHDPDMHILVSPHTKADARGCVFWNTNPVRLANGSTAPLFTHTACSGAVPTNPDNDTYGDLVVVP